MKKLARYLKGKMKLYREILLGRLNLQNDFVGYETLISYIKKNRIYNLNGDVVEIGAFMGGGTKKLARFFRAYNKKVIVIDVFDPSFDKTVNERNESMAYIYGKILGKRNLHSIFNENISKEENISVYAKDSKTVELPSNTKLCFSFIDGDHDPIYVKSDFSLLWNLTVSKGVVALHDYGCDLPQTTHAIDDVLENYKSEIETTATVPKKCLVFITKK